MTCSRGARIAGSMWVRCALAVTLSATAVLTRPSEAFAQESAPQTAEAQLAAVRELVLFANYRAALPAARTFLERTDLGAAQRNEGLEVLATIQIAMRDETSARATLQELFARDPGHRLRDADASPVVQSAFARARQSASPLAVELEHRSPTLERRVAPLIEVRVTAHADAVAEVRLSYRQRGESRAATVSLPLDPGGAAEGRIPLSGDEAAYAIEYWLEAVAPSDHVLGRVGSASEPRVVEVPEQQALVVASASGTGDSESAPTGGGDVASEAWFWTLIGVLVVGAGVGVTVGVIVGTEGPEDGSLGNVTLPLVRF